MGAGAATIGGVALSDIATDAAIGAAVGGIGSAVTGGNPLTGALVGGATGGIGGVAGPAVGSALDIGTTAGDTLVGAGLGAAGSAIAGGNPLLGAALGGAGGAIQGFTAPTTATGATVPGADAVTTGGGLSAAAPATSIAPPPPALATEAGGGIPDLTAGGGLSGGGGTAIDSSGLANVAAATGGIGPSNVATDAGLGTGGASSDFGLSSAAGYPLGGTIDTSTPLSTLGAEASANPTAAAAAAKPSTFSQFVSNVGSGNVGGALKNVATGAANNPGVVLGGLGLGYQALTAPSVPKAAQAPAITADQLALAGQAGGQATALESALSTGQLPPGAQSAIDQATKAAKARVISNYAARGMDTDPTTNASLAQDLNAIDQQAAGQVFQYADQLYQQGLSQAQISESLYNAILQNTTAQNDTMSKAISNFVTAAAGGGRPTVNINTGGGSAAAA